MGVSEWETGRVPQGAARLVGLTYSMRFKEKERES